MLNNQVKAAKTRTEVHPLIQKRWSPLSYTDRMITDEQMAELFEAASWAASAYNEQPWYYIYAHRDSDGFDKLWSSLAEGNQPWTKNASVIFAAFSRDTFARNGKPNPWAAHDLGMANAQLMLQAVSRDIYGHFMAGFDADKISADFDLGDEMTPVCVGVLGYLGDAAQLADSYRQREQSPRSRNPITSFTQKI